MSERPHNELRCFCARKPLLATYGVDANGRVYVHQKTYKQKRIFAESIVYSGEVVIHCRDCFRWHRVTFDQSTHLPVLKENPPPEELHDETTQPT